MIREDEVREALKYSQYTTPLKAHVKEWLQANNKPDDDDAVVNSIVTIAMQHYHYAASNGYEWQVETVDKLLKQINEGKSGFWKLTPKVDYEKGGSSAGSVSNDGKLGCAAYLLLLFGPIGWIIFYFVWKNSKK